MPSLLWLALQRDPDTGARLHPDLLPRLSAIEGVPDVLLVRGGEVLLDLVWEHPGSNLCLQPALESNLYVRALILRDPTPPRSWAWTPTCAT